MEQEADHEDPRKKIQFSVPSSVPSQLDPRQVEMIRRRRPTPATLFRLTDPPSPEEDGTSHQRVLRDNTALKAKLVHMTSYQPPSLKGEETAVGFWIILDYRMDTQLQFGQPRTCACSHNTSVHTRKKLNRSPEPKRTPTEAVQRMAQAHFASLDMTSVDGEDSFSGEEERQQPVKEMQGTTTATDERDENSSTSLRHHNDNEEAHEEVEEKGE